MRRVNQCLSAGDVATDEHVDSADSRILAIVALFCIVRIIIGLFHINDSLSYDELFSIKHYVNGPIGVVFGVGGGSYPTTTSSIRYS